MEKTLEEILKQQSTFDEYSDLSYLNENVADFVKRLDIVSTAKEVLKRVLNKFGVRLQKSKKSEGIVHFDEWL
jgi:hypothetical protein